MIEYIPAKGDIVYIDFNPQTGREQAKRRPAVVISPQEYNRYGLALFVPITQGVSTRSSAGFKVCIDDGNDKVLGNALCDQVKSLDWQQRNANKHTTLDKNIVDKIVGKIDSLIQAY